MCAASIRIFVLEFWGSPTSVGGSLMHSTSLETAEHAAIRI